MLADFGFIRITTVPARVSSEVEDTAFFMAPELLPRKSGLDETVPSKEADVYALGMTIYQILTGKRPFSPRRKAGVINAVISGERPAKPENAESIGIPDVVWDLLRECWKEDRATRPNTSDILGKLRSITAERKTTDAAIEMAGPRLDTTGNLSSAHSLFYCDELTQVDLPILQVLTGNLSSPRQSRSGSLMKRVVEGMLDLRNMTRRRNPRSRLTIVSLPGTTSSGWFVRRINEPGGREGLAAPNSDAFTPYGSTFVSRAAINYQGLRIGSSGGPSLRVQSS
jgi:serine/threonine protein kinase